MKKIIIKTLCAILLMAFAMSAVACGSGSIYDDLADEGYTVRVRFDAGEEAGSELFAEHLAAYIEE